MWQLYLTTKLNTDTSMRADNSNITYTNIFTFSVLHIAATIKEVAIKLLIEQEKNVYICCA